MTRTWQEVRVDVGHDDADSVANFLHESGSQGTIFESLGDRTRVIAHFETRIPTDSIASFCKAIGVPVAVSEGSIEEEDWAEGWKQHFPPVAVGSKLLIVPPWEVVASNERIAIVIDPGMAFGTGHHATTRGCLEHMEEELLGGRVESALDVGCGSGILAIAAARLGAKLSVGIDIDSEACAAARVNAELNGVADRVVIVDSDSLVIGSFDLVVANLFADLLINKAIALASWLRPGGLLVYSGLLEVDRERVAAAMEATALEPVARFSGEGWIVQSWRKPL